ncbi:MAG: acyl-CoA dehydrogenase [Pirellulaceae bacterium]|nr:MAG: acyl-CoA dehydrogenase [Pirellulaceae bacterium]
METFSERTIQAPSLEEADVGRLQQLCRQLASAATELDRQQQWPSRQFNWCRDAGLFAWFIPQEYGGAGWSEQQLTEVYLNLSQACLTTTFVLTQWNAACKRIIGSDNEPLKRELLPAMASGELFATVGISHLSTSRQHLQRPVLEAECTAAGDFLLDGFSPWVTGAAHADVIVTGATLPDRRQVMLAVPTATSGVEPHAGVPLVALTSSCTDRVEFHQAVIDSSRLLAGPVENVLATNAGGGAGGLQTSTLAIGLARAATGYLAEQARTRTELQPIADRFADESSALTEMLLQLTTAPDSCSWTAADLRQRANSLVLRATQAALTAAKGAGFVATHPTGRWAREALFFLVWSCPQPVANANLCELAQLSSD